MFGKFFERVEDAVLLRVSFCLGVGMKAIGLVVCPSEAEG